MISIEKNSGKRSLAKLMLNSFWGKFGQRENQPRTTAVTHEGELYELLSNPAIEVNHILQCGDNTVYVNWLYRDEAVDTLPTVNVVIAAYTTAQARLRLYDFLEPLGGQVLYYDTDSVIYAHMPGQFEPPTGNFLGDLTDELESYGVGSYITEFVCGGPKNYAYSVYSPSAHKISYVCKVKGITLNYKNSQLINFNTLKQMIINSENTPPVYISSDNIRRTDDHSVVTRSESKTYSVSFMKRRRNSNDTDTLPYGYVKRPKR